MESVKYYNSMVEVIAGYKYANSHFLLKSNHQYSASWFWKWHTVNKTNKSKSSTSTMQDNKM